MDTNCAVPYNLSNFVFNHEDHRHFLKCHRASTFIKTRLIQYIFHFSLHLSHQLKTMSLILLIEIRKAPLSGNQA